MSKIEQAPFTILIDSAEQHNWNFKGFRCDASKAFRPLVVPTRWESLGRHPNGMGDYSIDGWKNIVGIERKSVEDLRGTLLGWPKTEDGETITTGRRDRFISELENLSVIRSSAVIVEGTLEDVVTNVDDYGKKTRETQAKILFRSIIAMQQDYPVPWFFCNGRRWAETVAFRFLERFWRHRDEPNQ